MELYLVLPMFSVYLITLFNPMKKDNSPSPYQPPGWVFGVIWPILLIMVGYSWKLRPKLTPYYSLLTFLLSSWVILYNTNKNYGLLNILTTITLTVFIIFHKFKQLSSYLLIPLTAWLSFASFLSYSSLE